MPWISFHGGSGVDENEAISYGAIKMNIDTVLMGFY